MRDSAARAMDSASIGEGDKISVTIVRKTRGDKIVSQWSSERWFHREDDAINALAHLLMDLVKPGAEFADVMKAVREGLADRPARPDAGVSPASGQDRSPRRQNGR
ncbi:MAG: hypothetical protein M3312_06195 [Actinomycetota bacterium]|nr:hypothetical protein [Actinomycetota bacterium]